MQIIDKRFYSDGIELVGAFYLPDGEHDPTLPLVVPCSGFTGLRRIHPERFARALTARGYRCFAFDYRGHPPSAGKADRVLLEEQIRDIRHAVAFAASDSVYGADHVVLLGWGMAGGMILPAADGLPQISGLISANGFFDAKRVQRAVRGADGFEAFCAWLAESRAEWARTATPESVDAFKIYPLDDVSRQYVDDVLRKVPGYRGKTVDPAMADSLLAFAPERRLDHLAKVPLLIAHGDQNMLHPVVEATSLREAYPGPCELYWLKGGGHTEWMDDEHPLFKALAQKIIDWLGALHRE